MNHYQITMKTVFFKISEAQAEEVKSLMESEGYTSKAEFFRFLVKFFKYKNENSASEKLRQTSEQLKRTVDKLNEKGYFDNLPPLNEQLGL